jgi:hypothetical protein
MEIHAAALTLVVIGFGNVDDNQAIEMSRQRSGGSAQIAHEIESERRTLFLGRTFRGQAQPHNGINDATFGHFKLMPAVQVARQRQIWNQRVEPARNAKWVWIIGRDHPVADFMLLAIVAEVIKLIILAVGQRAPSPIFGWFQSGQLARGRQKPQHMTAGDTFHVFEENETATTIAMKCFHIFQDEGSRVTSSG